MPTRAKRLCAHCRTPFSEPRCPRCSPAQDRQRGTAHDRGYTSRWAKYSASYRIRHPLCVYCQHQGRTVASACVDHAIPPSSPSDPLFWDPQNHRAACIPCNSAKGRRTEAEYLAVLRRGTP